MTLGKHSALMFFNGAMNQSLLALSGNGVIIIVFLLTVEKGLRRDQLQSVLADNCVIRLVLNTGEISVL